MKSEYRATNSDGRSEYLTGRRSLFGLCYSIAAILLIPTGLRAQTRAVGVVVDSSGTPIPTVHISSGNRSVLTDQSGRFELAVGGRDSVLVAFRRPGYEPRYLVLDLAAATVDQLDVGRVVLAALPVELETIEVEDLAPIMSPRGILDFESARRSGNSVHAFTAYDIDRLRPRYTSDVRWRVPGFTMIEETAVAWTPYFSSRSCAPVVLIDGARMPSRELDFLVPPERIGGMYADVTECRIAIWTKPHPVGAESVLALGVRGGGASYRGSVGAGFVGGYVLVPAPVRGLTVGAALDVGTGRCDFDWRAELALRLRLPAATSPWYLGAGGRVERRDTLDDVERHLIPMALTGGVLSFGRLHLLGELAVYKVPGSAVRPEISVGLGITTG